MNKGLTNFQIKIFFQNEENEEIKENFMGVYSMDSVARYINLHEIKKMQKMVNILLQYLIQANITKEEHTGGVFWISILKNFFLFDGLGIEGFKFFIVNNN